MNIKVTFYSYFKELAGCAETIVDMPGGSKISDLQGRLFKSFPRLKEMERSTLIAVGVEYQDREYVLKEGEVVSLFPPVQGG